MKNFRNVVCVVTNRNNVQDMKGNLKSKNELPLLFVV